MLNKIFTYTLLIILILLILYYIRIFFISRKLKKQEEYIIYLFNQRVNIIPALYEVTEKYFSKHKEIFKEILKLRKQELYKYYIQEYTDNLDNEFLKLIHIEQLIHREINFIFKVSQKHPKLSKSGNFIYLRDLIINKSLGIGKNLEDYKSKVKMYNKLVFFETYKKSKI